MARKKLITLKSIFQQVEVSCSEDSPVSTSLWVVFFMPLFVFLHGFVLMLHQQLTTPAVLFFYSIISLTIKSDASFLSMTSKRTIGFKILQH